MRANSDIMRVLTTAIAQRVAGGDMSGVSIISVDTSPDYSVCRVHVDISGDEAAKQQTFAELERASGFLRGEIAKSVRMRQTPQLRFLLDRGRENAERVEELLSQIKGQ